MKDEKRHILVVNSGSSSLKLTLFSVMANTCSAVLEAHLKGIGSDGPKLEISSARCKETLEFVKEITVLEVLPLIFKILKDKYKFSQTSLVGIGHRFVHGGSHYNSSVQITAEVLANLLELGYLAPLHNPACVAGIIACRAYFGESIKQVAVFDTAFHSTLPAFAYNYAIPYELALKTQIRRYGFHGISHAFLWKAYTEHTGKLKAKIITVHLGNGCSMTAIENGASIDTSMGFTPAEGLVMGTRAGDIDAAIVEYLCIYERKTPSEIMNLLNFQSGLLGVSGVSSDMKAVEQASEKSLRAKLAIEIFCYRIVKYIGAYMAALGGADCIIFSGGIGENSVHIRKQIIEKMQWYGVELDHDANDKAQGLAPGSVSLISTPSSKVAVYVIATDENLFIAGEVLALSKF